MSARPVRLLALLTSLVVTSLIVAGSTGMPFRTLSAETVTDSTPRRAATPADRRVTALADTLVAALFEHYGEWETYFGTPGARHDRLSDNSLVELRRWERREDRWLATLRATDPASLSDRSAWVAFSMMAEGVGQSVATRACKSELWGVSQHSGWQTTLTSLADAQPVGTPVLRAGALAR